MNNRERDKTFVKKYYDQEAKNYMRKYTEAYEGYPTYTMRLNLALQCIREKNIKKILDCGCGSCGPMIRFLQEGYEVKGFDISPEMVNSGKKELEKAGFGTSFIVEGDVEDSMPFADERFDAVLAFGIFPHLKDEVQSLKKIGTVLNSEGYVYASFRNDLFALFSLNEYSYNFFMTKLIDTDALGSELCRKAQEVLSEKFGYDKEGLKNNNDLRYQDIYARFHNPFTVEKRLFLPSGFKVEKILFHHFHALPPQFGKANLKKYRELSLSLENPDDWKGYFMASTFLVEAKKI